MSSWRHLIWLKTVTILTQVGLKICKFIYYICNWIWTRCSHFFSAHPHMLQVQTQSFKYLSFTTSFLLGRTKYFVTVKWNFLLSMFKCFWRFLQSCNWKETLHLQGVFFNVRGREFGDVTCWCCWLYIIFTFLWSIVCEKFVQNI